MSKIVNNIIYTNKIKTNMQDIKQKRCSKCGIIKDADCFREINNKYRANCKDCERLYAIAYYRKNEDKILASMRTAGEKVKVKKRKRKRFFYYKAMRFRIHYNFKTDILPLAKYLWNQWRRQKGCCAITGRILTPSNAQIDHIIPRKRELVINDFYNLRWVTKEGNKLKSNMEEDVFKQLIIDVYNNIIR